MKTAIVYDRVNKWGGAERVLLALNEMFPDATLYTSVYDSNKALWAKVFPQVKTSFLQNFGFLRDKHELLGILMPLAFETLSANGEFDKYDLVVSVTSEAAKGIITKPGTFHICYCLTPTRYLWSHYNDYFKDHTFKVVTRPIVYYLRNWDKVAARRPDVMVAISTEVQKRIKKYYGRDSEVVFPPVEIEMFKKQLTKSRSIKNSKPEINNYFLYLGRLVDYKKIDLLVNVFNKLGKKLIIVGSGRKEGKLKKMAGNNILFDTSASNDKVINYFQSAKALIMPQEEDFGIVSVEAQAAGTPVIAYRRGGSIDTVVEGKTGVFFNRQKEKSLINAIEKFEQLNFEDKNLIKNAEKYDKKVFKKQIFRLIKKHIDQT